MTKIKLCGMMRPSDVIAARDLGADYVGFILSDGFRRSVGLGTFCELQSYLTGSEVRKVDVFVDEPPEGILKYYAEMLDIIQLHGSEDESYISSLRLHTGKPVIKAFTVRSEKDIEAARQSSADYVLLDSGTGSGAGFDYSLIQDFDRPFFLAGGLSAKNVAEAIDRLHPFAVDASSSLESNGKKDKNKMTEFVAAVRRKEETL